MHVLTKIFVVLVSLLAVLLVPLVVVYSHNEDSYKAKYESAQAAAAVARAESDAAAAQHQASSNRLHNQLESIQQTNDELERTMVDADAAVRRLQSDLASEQSMKAEIQLNLATIATTLESGQVLTDSLVNEVRGLRTEVLALERQKVDLDDALRDTSSQLEVAVQARRALQEQVQQLKDQLADATSQLGDAVAQGFNPNTNVAAGSLAPDVNLQSTVISVRRGPDQTLAEIDAGSRDGVKVGWSMSVGRGADFKGKIRIIRVDVNRATGVVTLEDTFRGRTVEVGDQAYARIGRD